MKKETVKVYVHGTSSVKDFTTKGKKHKIKEPIKGEIVDVLLNDKEFKVRESKKKEIQEKIDTFMLDYLKFLLKLGLFFITGSLLMVFHKIIHLIISVLIIVYLGTFLFDL